MNSGRPRKLTAIDEALARELCEDMTLTKIGHKLGVHRSTVKRALNPESRITEKLRVLRRQGVAV